MFQTPFSISNNIFEQGGCQFQNCSGIKFTQNKINKARLESEEDSIGVKIQLTVDSKDVFGKPDYGNYQITDNQITGVYEAGIKITSKNSGYKFNQLHIDHNSIIGEGLQYGIWITQPTIKTWGLEFWKQALIGTSNDIAPTQKKSIEVPGNYMIGMSEVSVGWVTIGSPNALIAANQGSTAIDKTRVADNKYIKNQILDPTLITALAPTRGWELQSEAGRQVLFKDTFHNILINPAPTTIVLASTSLHQPEVNVFGTPTWVENNPTASGSNIFKIDTQSKIAINGGSNPVATINSLSDCELKMQLQLIASVGPSNSNAKTGIVFRLNISGSTLSYWRLVIQYSNGAPNLLLETVGLTGFTSPPFFPINAQLNKSLVLKVLLKGEYISVFYNDLLVWNYKSTLNCTSTRHGMMTNNASFGIENFNILSH